MHLATMRNLLSSYLPLGVAAGCAVALAVTGYAALHEPAHPEPPHHSRRSPAELAELLARYDQLQPGLPRDVLALEVDMVAGQRYATSSRLYWYTDLAEAEAAARVEHRPILALRMLGRLDEDLSCANSRLFRTTLYANADVSRLLRDHFILYWSSERPVPHVTIDFGDGRRLERTTTGNSAHYVLDEEGHVLDVLPGLYAPARFRAELAASLELARRVHGLATSERIAATIAYHTEGLAKTHDAYQEVGGLRFNRDGRTFSELARAQEITASKASMERPDLKRIGIDPGSIAADDIAQWAAIGQRLWRLPGEPRRVRTAGVTPLTAFQIFDDQSLALIERLHNQLPRGLVASRDQLAAMIARLELNVVADTARDELQLRAQIRSHIIEAGDLRFDSLNTWIYADVFHTPKTDPWLGLLGRTDFTGLPGDGVVMP
ncbi:MAG: hypothetical protein H6Q90_454 [Deltaproteobacteria bacterium]|nr:hypothetical protein [Deltaproteobacteria bacterium]